MPVYETYSERKRRAEQGEAADVYQYDHAPLKLRIQVRHILDAALGEYISARGYGLGSMSNNNSFLLELHHELLKATGRLFLSKEYFDTKEDILEAVTTGLTELDEWLSVVELCFLSISTMRGLRPDELKDRGIKLPPKDAIEELNVRFRRAGFGYQFAAGQIVRVDSQYIHSEVVKPALMLLADHRFKGAREEFLSAHAHYRAGEHEDAIVNANKAFESTMKVICDIKRWDYKKARGAGDLINILSEKGLLPSYLNNALQSGLPQVRNKAGGHGQGAAPRETPGYLAGYALHLAAANIVLLFEAFKKTERK